MKTFLRMMKYLLYGVFALLFMMSLAFLGQESQWTGMLVFNAPALLYLAARLLFALFKSRSAWEITLFMIGWISLEVTLFSNLFLSSFALLFIGIYFVWRFLVAFSQNARGYDFSRPPDHGANYDFEFYDYERK
ncbi:hypothetical protein [Oceanimonas smirnovii]|uniref:hypothetical protein n=1 Tax=Oceanimonas smirnovii TaxID=264574 RepID=UPI0037702E82